MPEKQREGAVVNPQQRLSEQQIKIVDEVSRELLENPGILCYNKQASEVFRKARASVEHEQDFSRISIPSSIIDRILEDAPSTIVLGARNPDNRLILDSTEPRVRFVTGSETNIWLDVEYQGNRPRFVRREGTIERLCKAAHLCDNLENVDAFIRCVNIQDKEVTFENKDVNKFFASLNNITKHVQAGLTDLNALEDVMRMGQIIAGGKQEFEKNPVLSFIACVVKSPLQMVEDTAQKVIEISKHRAPVVISSSPMGGATAPFDEFGMVAQINAEILAGIALNQLVAPGAPVLYGSVPVRTRLDNLNDMYGAPEFNHYHHDCAQMARYYRLPCYSTAGVADVETPGIQATAEKMLTLSSVPWSGAQYIHYAFGLMERTNVFCPVQAVMDDAHIGMIKYNLSSPDISQQKKKDVLEMVREVMGTDHKTYMYHLPLPTKQKVYIAYPLEDSEGDALSAAVKKYNEIMSSPRSNMSGEMVEEINSKVQGILPQNLS
ncbi:MAG: trimethylamine methyltransferase family protein [Spirochaetota bacterium]